MTTSPLQPAGQRIPGNPYSEALGRSSTSTLVTDPATDASQLAVAYELRTANLIALLNRGGPGRQVQNADQLWQEIQERMGMTDTGAGQ